MTRLVRLLELAVGSVILAAAVAAAQEASLGRTEFLSSGSAAAQEASLGRTEFLSSGSAAAQPYFLKGLLLLHSFEYPDAAEEFRKAEAADPGFALAYWGEAMTDNHPLWMQRDRDAARKALQKLAPTRAERLAKVPTEREKLYLDAVEQLYADGEKADRDRAYAAAMLRLHEHYPDDLDAAVFYALALMGTCEDQRDVATYMRAAAVIEEVFAKNPQHPGAAHYLIHCYDDPAHAPLGMRPARVYATIAPAAVHALHMPSHIFFASGLWEDAVASNEASWKASVERAQRKSLGAGEHNFHALWWLEYAYLQLGRWRDARATLATMEADEKSDPTSRGADSLSGMRAAWIVETRRCGDGALPPASATAARDNFVRGVCALDAGDRAAAGAAVTALEAPAPAADGGHSHGGSMTTYGKERAAAAVARVLHMELEAMLALARGEKAEAVALAAAAAKAEDALTFDFGPPAVVKPAHELSGEVLLSVGRPEDARHEFGISLAHNPGRSLSLLGLARACAGAGDTAASREAYARLKAQWSHADADVLGRGEALKAASEP